VWGWLGGSRDKYAALALSAYGVGGWFLGYISVPVRRLHNVLYWTRTGGSCAAASAAPPFAKTLKFSCDSPL